MPPNDLDEKIQIFLDAFAGWWEATWDVIKSLADVYVSVLQDIAEGAKQFLPQDMDIKQLPEYIKACNDNPRISHLAYHHKKYRVRKKNLRRLEKISKKLAN
jgi:hypothetical protein